MAGVYQQSKRGSATRGTEESRDEGKRVGAVLFS